MGIKRMIDFAGINEIKSMGEQFMRYWKSVSEDLKKQSEVMNQNFSRFHDIFNSNMDTISRELTEIRGLIENVNKERRQ